MNFAEFNYMLKLNLNAKNIWFLLFVGNLNLRDRLL